MTLPTSRPEWLDSMRRPIRIIAGYNGDFGDFRSAWRFSYQEVRRVRDAHDLDGVASVWPILVLPRDFHSDSGLMYAATVWQWRGGTLIHVPENCVHGAPFPEAVSLVASTLVQLAKNHCP